MPEIPTTEEIERIFESSLSDRGKATFDALTFGALFDFRPIHGLEFLEKYQRLPKEKRRFLVTRNPYHVDTFDVQRAK